MILLSVWIAQDAPRPSTTSKLCGAPRAPGETAFPKRRHRSNERVSFVKNENSNSAEPQVWRLRTSLSQPTREKTSRLASAKKAPAPKGPAPRRQIEALWQLAHSRRAPSSHKCIVDDASCRRRSVWRLSRAHGSYRSNRRWERSNEPVALKLGSSARPTYTTASLSRSPRPRTGG